MEAMKGWYGPYGGYYKNIYGRGAFGKSIPKSSIVREPGMVKGCVRKTSLY